MAEYTSIYEEVIAKNGAEKQVNLLLEEMAELTVAINKYRRGIGSIDSIAEEIADVDITLQEAMVAFNCFHATADWRRRKLDELRERLDGNGRPL